MIQLVFKVEFLTHVTNRTQSLWQTRYRTHSIAPTSRNEERRSKCWQCSYKKKLAPCTVNHLGHMHTRRPGHYAEKKLHKCTWIVIVDCVAVCRKSICPSVSRANHFLHFGSRQLRSMSPPPTLVQRSFSFGAHIKRTLQNRHWKIIIIRCLMHAPNLPSAFILDAILTQFRSHAHNINWEIISNFTTPNYIELLKPNKY